MLLEEQGLVKIETDSGESIYKLFYRFASKKNIVG